MRTAGKSIHADPSVIHGPAIPVTMAAGVLTPREFGFPGRILSLPEEPAEFTLPGRRTVFAQQLQEDWGATESIPHPSVTGRELEALRILESKADSLWTYLASQWSWPISIQELSFIEGQANSIIQASARCVDALGFDPELISPPVLSFRDTHAAFGGPSSGLLNTPHTIQALANFVGHEVHSGTVPGLGGTLMDLDWTAWIMDWLMELEEFAVWCLMKLGRALGIDVLWSLLDATEASRISNAIKKAMERGDKQSVKDAAKAIKTAVKRAAGALAKKGMKGAAKAAVKAVTSTSSIIALLAWLCADIFWELWELISDYFNGKPVSDNPLYKAFTGD